jgi:hypothetical protein
MKSSGLIFLGAMIGFFAGLPFGTTYAIAGVGIGMAGAIAISTSMSAKRDRRD